MALTRINGRILKDSSVELVKLVEGAELIKRDGSVAFTGNADLNSNKIVNLADGADAKDAVNKSQLDAAIGGLANGLEYKGTFDASAGTYPEDITTGDFYKVSVAGTVDGVEYAVGDALYANNTKAGVTASADWDKVDNTDQVSSVAGKVGAVTLDIADITALQSNLDAKLDDSQLDTDTTLAADDDTKIASQKAVKAYIDSAVEGKDAASEISFDNTTSGLVATNVQDAVDEVEGRVDSLETLSSANGTIVNNEIPAGNVDNINKDFTLANIPKDGTVAFYLMGTRLKLTDDFTVSGDTVSLVEAPWAGENIIADYRY